MRKFVLAAVLVLMAGGAQAVMLDVVGGQLYGASGVMVDGSLYDVQFLDGRCIDLYNGCSMPLGSFVFQTEASALLASQALLDQVLLDGPQGSFDTDSSLTRGCSANVNCGVMLPFARISPFSSSVLAVKAINCSTPFCGDSVFGTTNQLMNEQLAGVSSRVYGVWSPIPEPSTALLLGLGLTGLVAQSRRRSRS